MLVSVIIPFHECLDTLCESVSSVSSSLFLPDDTLVEIIVCNDSHIDIHDISKRLMPFQSYPFYIRIVDNIYNRGPAGNRNTGIDLTTGHVLAFLDSDDQWYPEKLSLQLKSVASGLNFVASGYSTSDSYFYHVNPPTYRPWPSVLFSMHPIGTSTVLLTRELLGNHRFPDLYYCQDLLLWNTILSRPEARYYGLKKPLVNYNTISGRTSGQSALCKLSIYFKALNRSHIPLPVCILSSLLYSLRGVSHLLIKKLISPCRRIF